MSLFDRLFGRSQKAEHAPSTSPQPEDRSVAALSHTLPALYDPSHPAAGQIAKAEQLATSLIEQGRYGVGSANIQDMGDAYAQIKDPIDRAIELAPTDADLLYARASLHYLFLQGEDGKADRERCLEILPDHFDAVQKGSHFASWITPFHLPPWDVGAKTLPNEIADRTSRGQNFLLVRDHLRPAVAIVCPEDVVSFAGCRHARWDLHWVKTPAGQIAAHYVHLDTKKFAEFFVPHLASGDARVDHGYWQLRRLGTERYCFIVATRGGEVIYNTRYKFPATLCAKLANMAKDLAAGGPCSSAQQSQRAAQWHMDNSDPGILKY